MKVIYLRFTRKAEDGHVFFTTSTDCRLVLRRVRDQAVEIPRELSAQCLIPAKQCVNQYTDPSLFIF